MSITIILLYFLFLWKSTAAIRCDRRPFHTTHAPTVSNGRFTLTVNLGTESTKYLPRQQYVVSLTAKEPDIHPFTAFMVWPEGQTEVDPLNPRIRTIKNPGFMRPHDKFAVKISDRCPNTIEKLNAAPVDNVEMYWESPERDNGCVTLHAMVAENDEVWYQDGDLMAEVCEDSNFLGDLSAGFNQHCSVCEEAKYELTFQGKWSRNTHPYKFPEDDWKVYYGDMIGASHSGEYSMWKDGSTASRAMKAFALYNDTTMIETEILSSYAEGNIRTLIKGKGHGPLNGDMNDPTYALVRVDNKRHLISTATAMKPSPDWFLGVSEFELCQMNNTWLPYKTLDLIPWDAGVNKGISFESPVEYTSEPIGRVRVGSFDKESPFYNMNYKQLKPFATLSIRLIRTYPKECDELTEAEVEGGGKETGPEPPARRTSPPPSEDAEPIPEVPEVPRVAEGDEDCPLSSWDEWTPCSSLCKSGYRSRTRHHIVNGYEYRYYKDNERKPPKIEQPSEECLKRYTIHDTHETESCEGPCTSISPEALMASPSLDSSDSISRQSRTTLEQEVQDCVMSSWSRWSTCSGSCDEGTQARTRTVIQYPSNNGRRCPRRHRDVRKCILDPCPDKK